mmetsp:Transcript_27290/g.69419  ORF Transcript_27290/g.69419 Transcript_27290/m.69419 type:complete len:325 (-) Transcript_27290:212-1186(-)
MPWAPRHAHQCQTQACLSRKGPGLVDIRHDRRGRVVGDRDLNDVRCNTRSKAVLRGALGPHRRDRVHGRLGLYGDLIEGLTVHLRSREVFTVDGVDLGEDSGLCTLAEVVELGFRRLGELGALIVLCLEELFERLLNLELLLTHRLQLAGALLRRLRARNRTLPDLRRHLRLQFHRLGDSRLLARHPLLTLTLAVVDPHLGLLLDELALLAKLLARLTGEFIEFLSGRLHIRLGSGLHLDDVRLALRLAFEQLLLRRLEEDLGLLDVRLNELEERSDMRFNIRLDLGNVRLESDIHLLLDLDRLLAERRHHILTCPRLSNLQLL